MDKKSCSDVKLTKENNLEWKVEIPAGAEKELKVMWSYQFYGPAPISYGAFFNLDYFRSNTKLNFPGEKS